MAMTVFDAMMGGQLSVLTTEELQAELARRKQPKALKPQPLDNPDWTMLKELCRGYIEVIAESGVDGVDEDVRQLIFEEAIMAVYGKRIFDWVNAQ